MFSGRFLLAVGGWLAATTPPSTLAQTLPETEIHNTFVVPLITQAAEADYEVSVESISLIDVNTDISDIVAIHNDREFDVIAGLHWEEQVYDINSTNTLYWEMSVNDKVEKKGEVDLRASRALPISLNAGRSSVGSSGTHKIKVKITLDESESESEREYQSFAPGASFVPLVLVVLFAATTKMVRCSCSIICVIPFFSSNIYLTHHDMDI